MHTLQLDFSAKRKRVESAETYLTAALWHFSALHRLSVGPACQVCCRLLYTVKPCDLESLQAVTW